MKSFRTLFFAMAVAALASCQVNDIDRNADFQIRHLFTTSFEQPQGADTKTYVDSDLYMYWTVGDRLSIFTSTLNEQYEFDGETGDNSGTFTKIGAEQFGTGNNITTNYAVYPYNSSTKLTKEEKITLTLPATQAYGNRSFGLNANTMVAVTRSKSDYFLPFQNVCGYLVIKLYGEGTVKSVTLEGNNGEKIAGSATVTASYGSTPSVAMADGATTSITVDCGEGVALGSSASDATEFWFCIPPTTFSKGFTVTATNDEGRRMVRSVSSSKTVSRNLVNTMSALGTTFNLAPAGNVAFEDVNFKAYCVANFDTDGDGEISYAEAEVVTEMSFDTNGMKNLKGIEYFTNLTSLWCYLRYYLYVGVENRYYDSNLVEIFGLEELDISKNKSLTYLNCCYNQLTSLNVSKNTVLTSLSCNYNHLTSLDLSENTELWYLSCYNNQLTSLDVSKNTELRWLDCCRNQLTSLDISKNTALTYLDCNNNQLTSLDVCNNTALEELYCRSNKIASLDVSKNTVLKTLECNSIQLTSLDVSNNIALERLDCSYNQLTSLDLSKNTELTSLSCYYNQLTNLDLSKNTALTSLVCSHNQLTSLDVSKNTALTSLNCSYNQLTNLDLSKNTALTYLYCDYNQLTNLDVSNNIALKRLDCYNNQLTNLDLSKNTELTSLYCDYNQLTNLDLCKNTALTYLYCDYNQLTSLDVSKNTELTYMDCRFNHLTSLDISKNTVLHYLFCYENPYLSEIWVTPQIFNNLSLSKDSHTVIKYYGQQEYVDLGLSVKWATFDVGANAPWEYGGHYAWGETETQSDYTWESYKWRQSGDNWDNVIFSKYVTTSNYGTVDNKTVLEASDDVAHVKWGGSWRMPTSSELSELINDCTWTWTSMNGIDGYKVSGKKSGYTDKWIFLPAGGVNEGANPGHVGELCYYWSSTIETSNPYHAYYLSYYYGLRYIGGDRCHGRAVRPVTE